MPLIEGYPYKQLHSKYSKLLNRTQSGMDVFDNTFCYPFPIPSDVPRNCKNKTVQSWSRYNSRERNSQTLSSKDLALLLPVAF